VSSAIRSLSRVKRTYAGTYVPAEQPSTASDCRWWRDEIDKGLGGFKDDLRVAATAAVMSARR